MRILQTETLHKGQRCKRTNIESVFQRLRIPCANAGELDREQLRITNPGANASDTRWFESSRHIGVCYHK